MKATRNVLLALLVTAVAVAAYAGVAEKKRMTNHAKPTPANASTPERVVHTDAEWRKLLTSQQYNVLREQGTEMAFTGKYWNTHANGTYVCAACGYELFSSKQKFDSGTGWPSFWQPAIPSHVHSTAGRSVDMMGVEVTCARCGGHLGHVFDDGPKPTGLRYCINSAALKFEPSK